MSEVSVFDLRRIYSYDAETGLLTSLRYKRVVGWKDHEGYVRIKIGGRQYGAHRIAWAIQTGEWPAKFIDHKDGDKANNAFCNLREASFAENTRNKKLKSTSKTGIKGVYLSKHEKYTASIYHNGVKTYLGYFDCPAAASFAYQIASEVLHGSFSPPAHRIFVMPPISEAQCPA